MVEYVTASTCTSTVWGLPSLGTTSTPGVIVRPTPAGLPVPASHSRRGVAPRDAPPAPAPEGRALDVTLDEGREGRRVEGRPSAVGASSHGVARLADRCPRKVGPGRRRIGRHDDAGSRNQGCSACTMPAARSTTTRRLDGPCTNADETVTGRRPRTATTTRTSTAWPGVTASSVGGGAKAANGPVGSDSPAGCAVAETSRRAPRPARRQTAAPSRRAGRRRRAG